MHDLGRSSQESLLRSLPGSLGDLLEFDLICPLCVSKVVFHPTEPIVASGSSDKTIYLGELS